MIKDINGLGSTIAAKDTRAERGEKKSSETASTPQSSQGSQSSAQDAVEISSNALGLSALADKVASLPDVDIEKVNRIKAALENHEFNIDDLVLADKLLNSDDLLG
jgi:negative regulator of flagellin synthesis FlgM